MSANSPRRDPLAHRGERIARVALGVVRVHLQEHDAARGVVGGNGLEPLVPGQRVGAVVAGPRHDGGERFARKWQRVRLALGVEQLERGRRIPEGKAHRASPPARASAASMSARSGRGETRPSARL